MADDSKILILDIEWKPAVVYTWKMWDVNVSPDQIIDDGGLLCFCAHWYGSKEFLFYSEWDDGREGMARAALQLLSEADVVVTYNGDKYDLPKLTGEIVLAGKSPPPPLASVDLLKTVKKFGFQMNRLAYIGPLLKIGKKMKHEGFNLWKSVLDGDTAAQGRMKKYNIQDVKVTTQLYRRILPYIRNHPHSGSSAHECGNCGSSNTQKRGTRRTRSFMIQRNQCRDCGSWFETTRTKVK